MIRMVQDMWSGDWIERGLLLFVAAMIAAIPVLAYVAIQEQREWEVFAASHNCKVVERMRASTSTGFGFVGNKPGLVTTTNPAKTAYLCDDGVTYWR